MNSNSVGWPKFVIHVQYLTIMGLKMTNPDKLDQSAKYDTVSFSEVIFSSENWKVLAFAAFLSFCLQLSYQIYGFRAQAAFKNTIILKAKQTEV